MWPDQTHSLKVTMCAASTRGHKWWFTVRGEDLLQQVDGAWNAVAVQTA